MRWIVIMCCALVPVGGCFADPYEEIVIGSCRYEGDPVYLEARRCQEFFEKRRRRPDQKDVCRDNGGSWSDDPCDVEEACGHCVQPRPTLTLTTCFYPTEHVPMSEDDLAWLCEDGDYEDDEWIDNPDVSCDG